MKDWLGNYLSVSDYVLYSSTSRLTGMNLGELTFIDEQKIQIRLWPSASRDRLKGKIVTLHRGSSAFNSVTRYFGNIPGELVE